MDFVFKIYLQNEDFSAFFEGEHDVSESTIKMLNEHHKKYFYENYTPHSTLGAYDGADFFNGPFHIEFIQTRRSYFVLEQVALVD